MAPKRDYMTIGEVVERLQVGYPDLSISKVRFLEEEGLVAPERTPGGYRKFSREDMERIESILRLQREHFLPLAVIKDKLDELDRGRVPDELKEPSVAATVAPSIAESETIALTAAPAALGIPDSFLRELIDFGLIETKPGPEGQEISGLDVQIAHVAWDLRHYGVEPRHLRMYMTLADREAQLFAQILMPAYRHKTSDSRGRLVETLADMTRHTGDLKRDLLRRSLARAFDGML
jgi:DNA-binding transcriptional MerR regulator